MAITSRNNQHSTAPYYLGYIEGWEAPRFGSSKAAMFAAAEDASPFGFGDDIADQQFFEGFIAAVQEKQAGRALPSNGQKRPRPQSEVV